MAIRPQDATAAEAVQHHAAHAPEQQVRLIAGPGSGKSSTIVERVRWLLDQGIDPKKIAVISFTNASVTDLGLRLHAYCLRHNQAGSVDVSVSTVHAMALRLLRRANLLGNYPTRPLVLDDWELKNIYDEEFGRAQGIASIRRREKIRRYYEALWSTGQNNAPTYIPANPPVSAAERAQFDGFHQPTAQVYSCVLPGEIVRKCVDNAEAGVIDIGQLLDLEQLIVDEYQDLNPVDLRFVDLIAAAGVHVFVAGDDDQSVYSFRHASPEGIQTFPARYANAALHSLTHCFRCSVDVLAAARTLIGHNAAPARIAKNSTSLYATANPPNAGVVHRWRFTTGANEATGIAESCTALIATGLHAREILILLANKKSTGGLWTPIKTALDAAQLPYDPPQEDGFNETPTGRFVSALCRIICSKDGNGVPEDYVAHRTLLGLRAGVGVATCNLIRETTINTPNSNFRDLFYAALPNAFTGRMATALGHSRQVCAAILAWTENDTLAQRVGEITDLVRSHIDDAAAQSWQDFVAPLPGDMVIRELLEFIRADNAHQRHEILKAVAARLGNQANVDAEPPALDRIRVMTMHGAKGLDARVVFIPGLEAGLLPNAHQAPYPAQVMEAARLLYVSITRARAACIISYAQRRTIQGTSRAQTASRFAGQLGGAFVARAGGLTAAEAAVIQTRIGEL